jgi:sorting nexin-4
VGRGVSKLSLSTSIETANMAGFGDDDVYDSIAWDDPAPPVPHGFSDPAPSSSGPGFRQSTSESEEGRDPHEPKWEGYLITTVKDPVKELPETKDTYVSYLITAEVCAVPFLRGFA